MSWLIPRNELTPEQTRAIEFNPSENRAILGGPGSGKTQILLHRARYLCDHFGIAPNRFRIFVFTNVLKDYIKSAFSLLNLPEAQVLTFDHWCRVFYQENINDRLPWNYENKQPDFAAIRTAVRQVVMRDRMARPLYDFVLVDEAQDLDGEIFALLAKVAWHVTVCLDNKQRIYDHGSAEKSILRELGIRRRNINLIEAFRVCPYLVEVAALLIPEVEEREAFRNQTRQPQIIRLPKIWTGR